MGSRHIVTGSKGLRACWHRHVPPLLTPSLLFLPLEVRFGKYSSMRQKDRKVKIFINGAPYLHEP